MTEELELTLTSGDESLPLITDTIQFVPLHTGGGVVVGNGKGQPDTPMHSVMHTPSSNLTLPPSAGSERVRCYDASSFAIARTRSTELLAWWCAILKPRVVVSVARE